MADDGVAISLQEQPQEARRFRALQMLEHPTDLARTLLYVHYIVNWHLVIVSPLLFTYFLTVYHYDPFLPSHLFSNAPQALCLPLHLMCFQEDICVHLYPCCSVPVYNYLDIDREWRS